MSINTTHLTVVFLEQLGYFYSTRQIPGCVKSSVSWLVEVAQAANISKLMALARESSVTLTHQDIFHSNNIQQNIGLSKYLLTKFQQTSRHGQ